jgi:light-regulated signal transduction histidine kinase (bacteriophytochrome)
VHLEYLRNMGVAASMSVSLMHGERLWGLVACHHRTPRFLPYATRAACELLGRIMSVQIRVQEERDRLRAQLEARSVQTRFFEFVSDQTNFVEALERYTPTLLEMMHAGGAAIRTGTRWTRLGEAPDAAELDAILPQIEALAQEGIFHSDEIAAVLPDFAALQGKASGLLFVALSAAEGNCIVFFRPEVTSVIEWAGNPTKAVEEGTYRLHPRKSFAAWQQTVSGRSLPWRTEEIEAALELRRAFNASILQRTDRLLRLSAELERKNTDLNSFAYVAAHDLKEPVRGIHHYTSFVLEDHGERLPDDGREMLETVKTLALRIDELLSSLLHFSAIGRVEVASHPVSIDRAVDEVLVMLQKRLADEKIEIRRPTALPTTYGDRPLLREVFANLITNALKYNDKPQRWIEIGSRPDAGETTSDGAPAALLYVRDNGIGIREKHLEDVFTMFRRLHDRAKFGGGTGAGLAIVKTIVEKHGGRIWADSTYGEGTTFLFTLPQANQS